MTMCEVVIRARKELDDAALDNVPQSISWHLETLGVGPFPSDRRCTGSCVCKYSTAIEQAFAATDYPCVSCSTTGWSSRPSAAVGRHRSNGSLAGLGVLTITQRL
ncbi:hypothetical protein R4P64_31140 [Rhodococcus sp. IEGM 1366]|uniref:hypothetical protein n=1 Tax=Rhodococcus sp. IEGM 1366 TaxID=3082223 RepID=UPI002952BD6E|nr:hypothetical protein [Rhodococcus sp. IEGM 1366]MDV8070980.1 hypothetical protein [Rhodococcus sp. IEGM 1366]